MKAKKSSRLLPLFAAGLGLAVPASAQFVTGFEASEGYVIGNLNGVDDPALPGPVAWHVPATLANGGSVQSHSGSQALRISDTNTTAYAIALNLAGAIDYSKAFTFSFDIALASSGANGAAGSTPFINVRLGTDTNSNSNKSWLRFSSNVDGSLSLWTNSGGATTAQTNVGNLADFVSAGAYLSVSISIDPVTHTYTNLTLSGDLRTETITSISGLTLPWIPNTAGEPPAIFWAHTTGAAISTSYIDNVSLTNIPEPSAGAALLGLGGLSVALGRRVRRARRA